MNHSNLLSFAKKITLLICLLTVNLAWALPQEIELDRYLLAAKKHIEAKDYEAAEVYLLRIESLKVTPPADYYFYSGTVDLQKSRYKEARDNLSQYVQAVGKGGEFYEQALTNITLAEEQAEQATQEQRADLENNKKQQAFITSVSEVLKEADKEYDNKIKDLYLSAQLDTALVQHINSLLISAPYTGKKLITKQQIDGVVYSISTAIKGQIITRRQDQRQNIQGKNAEISTYQLNVYGRDFLIDYLCSRDSSSCWINKPDGRGKWIEIAYDESTAKELKKALSRLIKVLQAG